ncbi:uncharacterized protein LOC143148234 isoform X2 [Ptiloglossa arizonensis]|uniref:uncharacterized protein LOC143148234 isoform X2 n=1 Tax=Ptiloglossa arizonensis TaxID=3350558 RepID=UPI003F9FBACF
MNLSLPLAHSYVFQVVHTGFHKTWIVHTRFLDSCILLIIFHVSTIIVTSLSYHGGCLYRLSTSPELSTSASTSTESSTSPMLSVSSSTSTMSLVHHLLLHRSSGRQP